MDLPNEFLGHSGVDELSLLMDHRPERALADREIRTDQEFMVRRMPGQQLGLYAAGQDGSFQIHVGQPVSDRNRFQDKFPYQSFSDVSRPGLSEGPGAYDPL